ncbi:hypothetical protein ABPG72_007200 [Tetrahymena utriculariae]
MQNIIEVLEELKISGDFLVLEKIQKNYYLYSNNDCHLKYSESWQTTNFNLEQSYQQHLNKKIDISSLFSEFKKYLNNIIQYMTHLNTIKRFLTNQILNEELIADVQESNQMSYFEDQNYFQQNYPQEFENIFFLQGIIDNYQVLLIQLKFEEENLQIQFKNPLCIELKQLKTLKLQSISLSIDASYIQTLYDSSIKRLGMQDNNNVFESQLTWLLEKNNLIVVTKYLHLFYIIYATKGCESDGCLDGANDREASLTINLPKIQANYIYLDLKSCYSTNLNELSIHLFSNLKQNERCKILIQNQIENRRSREVYLSLDAIEIPSILDNYRCFINTFFKSQQSIEELFLEDQYILMISVFLNNEIDSNLCNNLYLFMTDLIEL